MASLGPIRTGAARMQREFSDPESASVGTLRWCVIFSWSIAVFRADFSFIGSPVIRSSLSVLIGSYYSWNFTAGALTIKNQ